MTEPVGRLVSENEAMTIATNLEDVGEIDRVDTFSVPRRPADTVVKSQTALRQLSRQRYSGARLWSGGR